MSEQADPAAVFACAVSLRDACEECETTTPALNLSQAYNGYDQFQREVVRVGSMFEEWACHHVAFADCDAVWPYMLQERFGEACLEVLGPEQLAVFDSDDCLRVAMELRLPLWVDVGIPVPFVVEVDHPVEGAGFGRLRIQTVRERLGDDPEFIPFVAGDDPFDEELGPARFSLYGIGHDGPHQYITDRRRYRDARGLLMALVPGIDLPEEPISETFSRKR